jgi:2-methylcitrate dehydratase PrpD
MSIRGRIGTNIDAIRKVTVEVGAVNGGVCNIVDPHTAAEARFSLRMMAAYALGGIDTAKLDNFDPALIRRDEVQALRRKIDIVLRDELAITFANMTVELEDGRTLSATSDCSEPATDLNVQEQRLTEKFQAIVPARLGSERAERLLETLLGLERLADFSLAAQLWTANSGAQPARRVG